MELHQGKIPVHSVRVHVQRVFVFIIYIFIYVSLKKTEMSANLSNLTPMTHDESISDDYYVYSQVEPRKSQVEIL